jgi:hypothetical protein
MSIRNHKYKSIDLLRASIMHFLTIGLLPTWDNLYTHLFILIDILF